MSDIYTGKRVRCTTARGGTYDTIARSEPHLNTGQVGSGVTPWMVIAVDHAGFDHPVNWPADDVELIP